MSTSAERRTDDIVALATDLSAGDEFLFNDRVEPLRVCDQTTSGQRFDAWGPRGGHYTITVNDNGTGHVHKLTYNASDGYQYVDRLQRLEVVTWFEDQTYEAVEPAALTEGDRIRFGENADVYTVDSIAPPSEADAEYGEYELRLDTPAGPHSPQSVTKLVYADAGDTDDDRYRIGRTVTANTMYRRVD